MLVLSEEEAQPLISLADMPEVIDRIEEVYRLKAAGEVTLHPTQTIMYPPETGYYTDSAIRMLMGFVPKQGAAGMRVYSLYHPARSGAASTDSTSLSYELGDEFLLLWRYDQGMRLAAIMAAHAVNNLRTAAPTGVATRWMAREASTTLGVIGSGRLAPWQIKAICDVRPIERVRIFSRTPDHRERLADELRAALSRDVRAVETARSAVEGADIVLTVTSAGQPVLDGDWLKPGAHVNVVARGECDEKTVLRARWIACSLRDQITRDRPAFQPVGGLLERGLIQEARFVDLDRVMTPEFRAARGEADISLFLSQGIGIWDTAMAAWLYEKAVRLGAGREIAFNTRPPAATEPGQ